MIRKINRQLRRDEGFSLIELLIVVAIIGILAAIATPQLINAMGRSRQRRSMADMRQIATANGMMRLDTGSYASSLADLAPTYLQVAPTSDAWGTAFGYTTSGDTYTITSFGADRVAGPPPPGTWVNDPYEPDIMLTDGQFVQAPGQ